MRCLAWKRIRISRKAVRWDRGIAALEFALVSPVFFLLLLGIMYTSLLFNNYLELTYSLQAATRVMATGRGSATPYTSATSLFYSAAPNLVQANVTLTVSVAGTACTSDSTCGAALSANAGGTTAVSAKYPCNMDFMGINFIPGCTLTSQTTGRVE